MEGERRLPRKPRGENKVEDELEEESVGRNLDEMEIEGKGEPESK